MSGVCGHCRVCGNQHARHGCDAVWCRGPACEVLAKELDPKVPLSFGNTLALRATLAIARVHKVGLFEMTGAVRDVVEIGPGRFVVLVNKPDAWIAGALFTGTKLRRTWHHQVVAGRAS